MAKYCGVIGYAVSSGTDGIWTETMVERKYCGDVVKNNRRIMAPDKVNSDVTVTNQISIVSDPYALQNVNAIRYATYMGAKWTVADVEVQYPRLILSLGGIYNA